MSKANLQRIGIFYNLSKQIDPQETQRALSDSLEKGNIKLVPEKQLEEIEDKDFVEFLHAHDLVKQGGTRASSGETLYDLVKAQYPQVAEIFDPVYEATKKISENKLTVQKDGKEFEVWFSPVWRSKEVSPDGGSETE